MKRHTLLTILNLLKLKMNVYQLINAVDPDVVKDPDVVNKGVSTPILLSCIRYPK